MILIYSDAPDKDEKEEFEWLKHKGSKTHARGGEKIMG